VVTKHITGVFHRSAETRKNKLKLPVPKKSLKTKPHHLSVKTKMNFKPIFITLHFDLLKEIFSIPNQQSPVASYPLRLAMLPEQLIFWIAVAISTFKAIKKNQILSQVVIKRRNWKNGFLSTFYFGIGK
jgi:hypothetical protein